jgi:branched-subunit amino acid aminotransferase/4-amino-4-deoxychorismate lyase
MRGWLHRDGAWTVAEALPFTDRGVRYGMSVFETIGVRDGRALLFHAHAARLAAAAKALLGIDIEPVLPPLETGERGVLRLYVTAGDGSPSDAVSAPRLFALFEALQSDAPDFQTARLHPEPVTPFAHGAKTGNYWMQCDAQSAARAAGFDHALLSDRDGYLLSGAMGNVFFVYEGQLCTPSSGLSVRAGVVREWVMTQEKVQEVGFKAPDLEKVGEIFLTNSRLGVMPLKLGNVSPGPAGCALRDRCRGEKIIP